MADQTDRAKAKGALLQRMREDAKLDQADVADGLGVTRVTVSRWETGATKIRDRVVRELVMWYMSRGAKLSPEEADGHGIEIPRRTADRRPGEPAYRTPTRLEPDDAAALRDREVRERDHRDRVRLSEISGYAKAVMESLQLAMNQQREVIAGLAPWVIEDEPLGGASTRYPNRLTPNATPEELDRALARQTTPDVLATPDPERARG